MKGQLPRSFAYEDFGWFNVFLALGIEPRALYLLGKPSTSKPIPRSYLYDIISAYYFYSKTKPRKLEGENRREKGRMKSFLQTYP